MGMSAYEVLETLFECEALRVSCGQSLQGLPAPGEGLSVERLLDLAVGLTQASTGRHPQRIVPKKINPAHMVVNMASGQFRPTGFGVADAPPQRPLALQQPAANPTVPLPHRHETAGQTGRKPLQKKESSMKTTRLFLTLLILATAALMVSGQPADAAATKRIFTVWFNAGLGNALKAMELNIEDFHKAQDTYAIEMTLVPEGAYTDRILAAGKTGDLPDLLFFDGPTAAYLAWLGYLQPIDRFVSEALKADLLPSIIAQGTYNDRLYALGIYDSGLAIYANRTYLAKAGVRIPTVAQPWDLTEFEAALGKLTALDAVDYALDMKINYGRGEWFTYGFSPILQSFGGDLIDRKTHRSAKGVLDGPQSVAALERFQSWFQKGWSNPKPAGDDDFYGKRKAALSWVGHWMYSKHTEALGDDLVMIPMPDFGHGPKTGMGSWTWGISSSCRHPEDAWTFLEFILGPDKILRWTTLHPGVPARKSALAQSALYKPHGPLHLYVQQIEAGWAVPRPATPAYAAITGAFAEAIEQIVRGADVQTTLNQAAKAIDQDIEGHQGYPPR
jgi:multiple sugar transport system substrate-binding protein